jgi:hypothetical protein
MSWVTSVTASTNTAILVAVPIVGYVARDAEDAAEPRPRDFMVARNSS